MHLIMVVMLGFMGCALLFKLNTRKTALSLTMFCIGNVLTLLSFLIFVFTYFELFNYASLGTLFSVLIGPFMLLLVEEKPGKRSYYFCTALVLSWGGGGVLMGIYHYPASLPQLEDLILSISIVSCCSFGGYGYLKYVNQITGRKYWGAPVLFYVVLLFLTAFVLSMILLIGSDRMIDSNALFQLYSFCVLLFILCYDGVLMYSTYLKKPNSGGKKIKWNYFDKTNVTLKTSSESLRERRYNKEQAKTVVPSTTVADVAVIRQLLYVNLIESHLFLDSNLTLNKVSELIEVDKSKLIDYFKRSESLSFKQYINRLKVEYAINVIREREKDITVEELTFISGFNTRLSFYRAFVFFYGFPPSELLND